ncbi:MAG: NIPSNAP family protein [Acidobacteriota bacterium]
MTSPLFHGLLATALAAGIVTTTSAAAQDSGKVFELRTYITYEGRLEALNTRFADHSIALLRKHGAEVVAFWTPVDGNNAENTLIYIVAFPSREARDQIWHAVFSDPTWPKIKADSEKGGKVVKRVTSRLMTATEYSPLQ